LDATEKKRVPVTDLDSLYEFNLKTREWDTHKLLGQHPPGVYDGACTVVGDVVYFYGGLNQKGDPTGSLFELDLITKTWREWSCPGNGGPQKKYSCGMVNYGSTTLIIYGGLTAIGKTNELHVFDIKSRKFRSPRTMANVIKVV